MDIITISDSEANSESSILTKWPAHEEQPCENQKESRPSVSNEIEIVTLSSKSKPSTERCPVTWSRTTKKTNLNFLNSDTFMSPSPTSKVQGWLQQNTEPMAKCQTMESFLADSVRMIPKSSILERQDYKKSPYFNVLSAGQTVSVNHSKCVNGANVENHTICLESSSESSHVTDAGNVQEQFLNMKESINNSVINTVVDINTIQNNHQDVKNKENSNSSLQSVRNTHDAIENIPRLCDRVTPFTRNPSMTESEEKLKPSGDVPLSPETERKHDLKKRELCAYLKLMHMNHSDEQPGTIRQNRRSSRVQNLALMSVRREQDRQFNNECRERERKHNVKVSDSDSRHSTDTDSNKGGKSSVKHHEAAEVSSLCRTPTPKRAPSRKHSTDESKSRSNDKSEKNFPSIKIPSKFLQVPEVSTTSVSKPKTPTTCISVPEINLMNKKKLTKVQPDDARERVTLKALEMNRKKSTQNRVDDTNKATRMPSCNDRLPHKKQGNYSSSSSDSNLITKKSLIQLSIDVRNCRSSNNITPLDSHKLINDETSSGVHQSFDFIMPDLRIINFDETMKTVLNTNEFSHFIKNKQMQTKNAIHLKTELLNTTKSNMTAKFKHTKLKNDAKVIARKRKASPLKDIPKSKIPKFNGVYKKISYLKMKMKEKSKKNQNSKSKKSSTEQLLDSNKQKTYASARHAHRLRSRGRLKDVRINTILLKEKKKRSLKKKLKNLQFRFKSTQKKDFRSAELIQHGSENNFSENNAKDIVNQTVVRHIESVDKQEPNLSPVTLNLLAPPRVRMNKKSEDLLTPEHRKALFECRKYLKESSSLTTSSNTATSPIKNTSKDTFMAKTTVGEDIKVTENGSSSEQKINLNPPQTGAKIYERDEICEDIDKISRPVSSVSVAQKTTSKPLLEAKPSLEDLEVDRLMSRKAVKDQATQKGTESPDLTSNIILTDIHPIHTGVSCCTSSSNSPASSSSSSQIAESNSESTSTTLKPDSEEISNTPNCDTDTNVNNSSTDAPNSAIQATVRDRQVDNISESDTNQPEVINITEIPPTTCKHVELHVNNTNEVKSLHHYLMQSQKKRVDRNRENSPMTQQHWNEYTESEKSPRSDHRSSQSHTIYLSKENGDILNAYYLDYNLIIVQELVVSFWNQTPLGNILGTQDMWIPKGNIPRSVLGDECVPKDSSEMVISLDNSIAYVELWAKEHKWDKRTLPVADIFVVIYLSLNKGLDKKVLQLENIKGFARDVQYIVLRSCRSIIVSWYVKMDGVGSTVVHCYQLSKDYQTVTNIKEMQGLGHHVSSLHNIEDCDTLIMGSGEHKITLWDVEDGYVVATVDLNVAEGESRILWTKRDRGFLFLLQHFNDGLLYLIAINTFHSTWKKLQVYSPEQDHDNILGVWMENGLVMAFYDTGIVCWKAKTGDIVVDILSNDSIFLQYRKYVVEVLKTQVHVRHALEYFVAAEES